MSEREQKELAQDNEDPRSDIQQAVESRADEVAARGSASESIANGPGDDDGVSGTAGEVKNQDRNQQ